MAGLRRVRQGGRDRSQLFLRCFRLPDGG
jgi:hypothetical protein